MKSASKYNGRPDKDQARPVFRCREKTKRKRRKEGTRGKNKRKATKRLKAAPVSGPSRLGQYPEEVHDRRPSWQRENRLQDESGSREKSAAILQAWPFTLQIAVPVERAPSTPASSMQLAEPAEDPGLRLKSPVPRRASRFEGPFRLSCCSFAGSQSALAAPSPTLFGDLQRRARSSGREDAETGKQAEGSIQPRA